MKNILITKIEVVDASSLLQMTVSELEKSSTTTKISANIVAPMIRNPVIAGTVITNMKKIIPKATIHKVESKIYGMVSFIVYAIFEKNPKFLT